MSCLRERVPHVNPVHDPGPGDVSFRHRAVILHTTLYDGYLEEAAVDLNIPTYSVTESRVCAGYSKTCLGNQLLEDRVAGFASEFSC